MSAANTATLGMRPLFAPSAAGLAALLEPRRGRAERSTTIRAVPASGAPGPRERSAMPHADKTRLPLYHRPGSVVCVDDDPDFLDSLEFSLPKSWNIRTFESPTMCRSYLLAQTERWELDLRAQQEIVDQWRGELSLVAAILAYWASSPGRHLLPTVCLCDYMMPGMNGVELLSQLHAWPGRSVMLTGTSKDSIEDATDLRLVEHFIPKTDPRLRDRIHEAVTDLLVRPDGHAEQIWQLTLSPAQLSVLRNARIGSALRRIADTRWIEWVVIGDPFGILGVDIAGNASWLQLEPVGELAAVAELAEVHGATAQQIQDIRAGRALSDVELQQALGALWPADVRSAFDVDGTRTLFAALQDIPTSSLGRSLLSVKYPATACPQATDRL